MQSSSQITTTNKPTSSFFTGRMPFLSPNQQCQITEGKIITFHGLAYPKLTWDLPTLSLTTNSSWLPWGELLCLSSALWCQYLLFISLTPAKASTVVKLTWVFSARKIMDAVKLAKTLKTCEANPKPLTVNPMKNHQPNLNLCTLIITEFSVSFWYQWQRHKINSHLQTNTILNHLRMQQS